jgi:hypothetical protein
MADVVRRLNKAKDSLDAAVVSLDNNDPEGARYALDEVESQIKAASGEARTTSHALAVARDYEGHS